MQWWAEREWKSELYVLSDDKTINDFPAHVICKFNMQSEWEKNNAGLKYAYFILYIWRLIYIYYDGTIDNNIK